MYNNERSSFVGTVNMPTEEIKFPMLESNMSTLYNFLNEQENLINQIQQKVHKILIRNIPINKKEVAEGVTPATGDIAQEFSRQINRLNENNIMLEIIVKHLSEII